MAGINSQRYNASVACVRVLMLCSTVRDAKYATYDAYFLHQQMKDLI